VKRQIQSKQQILAGERPDQDLVNAFRRSRIAEVHGSELWMVAPQLVEQGGAGHVGTAQLRNQYVKLPGAAQQQRVPGMNDRSNVIVLALEHASHDLAQVGIGVHEEHATSSPAFNETEIFTRKPGAIPGCNSMMHGQM
jgi:hypothetical protein